MDWAKAVELMFTLQTSMLTRDVSLEQLLATDPLLLVVSALSKQKTLLFSASKSA